MCNSQIIKFRNLELSISWNKMWMNIYVAPIVWRSPTYIGHVSILEHSDSSFDISRVTTYQKVQSILNV